MFDSTQEVAQNVADVASWMYEKITEIGQTADGWILCVTESGKTLFREPTSGELIDPTA